MKLFFTRMLLCAFLCGSMTAFAQVQSPLNIALAEVNENYTEWGLTKTDITDMFVSDLSFNEENGIARVYFQQRYAGIKAHKAILNVAIDAEGKVFFVGKRFVPNLSGKISTTLPTLDAAAAVNAALTHLTVTPNAPLQIKEQNGSREVVFAGAEFAKTDIEVELQYALLDDENVRLAWDMVIDPRKDSDRWSMRIDALTGEVLQQENWTIYCNHVQDTYHNHDASCREKPAGLGSIRETLTAQSAAVSMLAEDDAQYNVFAVPTESPAHGDRVMVQNPAWLPASPYGWHDTDGVDGPEYTITRGNNTWAWEDRDDNQSSAGDEPDGGEDLIFDYFYSNDAEPTEYIDAAVTNLFYMVNVMHDFAFANGMTTDEGSFQENNYGGSGQDGDPVMSLAQASADAGSVNNAFYSHANDGSSPSVNMFVWDQAGGAQFLQVDAPSSIGGLYDTGVAVDWGAEITSSNGVSGQVVEVNDDEFNPYATDACEELQNGDEVDGKIALIDRGGCQFGTKALTAQNSGAIGVIICNFADETINMAAGDDGPFVNIPVVFIKSNDCQTIRQFAGDGLEVTLVAPDPSGPNQLDGDLDNGIIAHEFGHGISIRMTCGANTAGLGNAEQMGEGWSDFFGLVVSAKEGDVGEMRRGVGTYVQRQPNDGRGIRRYPYSTDVNISPLTYGDVAGNTGVHAVGEVWCNMIWDLYWAMVDEYGFDPDIYDGDGGNNRAVKLVFEGMAIQPCSPGFVDGRDAILAADEALYGGENQCLIWDVFARRGVGFYADQGSANSATDQIEDFEPRPTCIQELKITKEVTPLVNPGEDIDVTITIINHKPEAVTEVVVTDDLPAGTQYIAGSGTIDGTVSGNTVSFDLGTMQFEDEIVLSYKLSTDPSIFSERLYYNDMEGDVSEYFFDTFDDQDLFNPFELTDANSFSGEKSYFVEDVEAESRDALLNITPFVINAENPVIRFYHNYDTEGGADAGLFELTTDEDPLEGSVWQDAGADFFRGDYPGLVQYGTFVVPNLEAFSGNSGGWVASYADMSAFAGEQIYLRWRFGTDDNTPGFGWYIDDIEYMDMKNYVSDATVTSAEGDNVSATPKGRGTVIESQIVDSVFEPVTEDLSVSVFPNPAHSFVQVRMNTTTATDVEITLTATDGRMLQSYEVRADGETDFPLNVSSVPEGLYFLNINADGHVYTEKVIITK